MDVKWEAKTKSAMLHFIWKDLTLPHPILSLEKVLSRLYKNFRRHVEFLQIRKAGKGPLLNFLLHNREPLLALSRGVLFIALFKVHSLNKCI